MDPLSLTASIFTIAGTVMQIQKFARDVNGAKADMNRLCGELLALKGVLEHIQYLVQPSQDGPAPLQSVLKEPEDNANIFRSPQFNDIIEDTNAFLVHLQEKLGKPKGHLRTTWDRFVWPASKVEIAEHIARIERAKTYIVIVMLGDNFESSRNIYQEIKDLIARLDEEKLEEKLEWSQSALLRRLAPVDPTQAHREACNSRLPDTGLWLLRGHRFRTWYNGPQGSAIWLCGKSGAGKTIIVSSAIEYTTSLAVQSSKIGVAYFYCTFNDAASQEPLNILGSIIAQLARKQPSLLYDLESIEAKFANLTLGDLEGLLKSYLAFFNQVYIFIDAVNESGSSKDIIGSISKISKHSENLFVFLSSIEETLDSRLKSSLSSTVITMRPDEISADMEKVIDSSLQHRFNHLKLSSALRTKIRTTLVYQAHGMFRWVQCQLDLLATCRTPAKVEIALRQRPKTIEDTYSAMLNQIKDHDRNFARNALLWLSYARRPLILSELCEAIVFEDDCEELDDDHRLLPKPEVIHEICAGLISVNPDTQEAALAHFSVRTYLASLNRDEFFHIHAYEARESIARKCLQYMSFPAFSSGFCSIAILQQKRKSWPLLEYTALHWPIHVERLGDHLPPAVERLMHNFFDSSEKKRGGAYGFWLRALNPDDEWEVQHTEPLYYAASFGLVHVVRSILKSTHGADIDAQGGRIGWTALQSAVYRGRYEVVKLLLHHGANPYAQDSFGETALDIAQHGRDAQIERLLRDAGGPDISRRR